MERVEVTDEKNFALAVTNGIVCVAHEGGRHIVNDAFWGRVEWGDLVFGVETLNGKIHFDQKIILFIFQSAREAQQFLNFERCEFDEDKVLNDEIIS